MQESTENIFILKSDEAAGMRLKYTLDFMNAHPHFQDSRFTLDDSNVQGKTIHYTTTKSPDCFWVFRQNHFYAKYPFKKPLFSNSYRFRNQLFYSVESENNSEQILSRDSISFDIFESIFFHISRYEEWFCNDVDLNEWDALKEEQHFLVASNLHRLPIVDHLLLLLRAVLQLPPKPIQTKIVLTHDIDYLKKYSSKTSIFRKIAGHLWRGERLAHLPGLIGDYFRATWKGQADPYQNLPWLLDQGFSGDKYLFLIVGGQHKFDPPHKSESVLREVVELAVAKGYTVGLHPSYSTDKDPGLLTKEYQRLSKVADQTIIYSRQHYLHFDFRNTPQNLIDVGIKHDFTMGYNRHVGFRCGTAFPYLYYSFEKEEAINLVCHPLAFMDSSCFHESGQNGVKFQKIFSSFFATNKESGILNVNFHNQFFDTARYYDIPLAGMYQKLLSEFS